MLIQVLDPVSFRIAAAISGADAEAHEHGLAGLRISATLSQPPLAQLRQVVHVRVPAVGIDPDLVAKHAADEIFCDRSSIVGSIGVIGATFEVGLHGQARVVAQALKTYGALVADNGSAWYVSGAPSKGWHNDEAICAGSATLRDQAK